MPVHSTTRLLVELISQDADAWIATLRKSNPNADRDYIFSQNLPNSNGDIIALKEQPALVLCDSKLLSEKKVANYLQRLARDSAIIAVGSENQLTIKELQRKQVVHFHQPDAHKIADETLLEAMFRAPGKDFQEANPTLADLLPKSSPAVMVK